MLVQFVQLIVMLLSSETCHQGLSVFVMKAKLCSNVSMRMSMYARMTWAHSHSRELGHLIG